MQKIIIGKNSKLWQKISKEIKNANILTKAISHKDIPFFFFPKNCTVVILSYSRSATINQKMFLKLREKNITNSIYVSSISTVVCKRYPFYDYPSIKQKAENDAIKILGSKILRIGFIYAKKKEIPNGKIVATNLKVFFNIITRKKSKYLNKSCLEKSCKPFLSRTEKMAYLMYGKIILSFRYAYLLIRPVDFIFAKIGWKWYGYNYLTSLFYFKQKNT